eukprot:TRINITY_DN23335_c0_g2_i1.p1 TRINITY_DN23335_c0_g2~~TRINITY_DN23335_c0_g2_i1.p1  ORF type:complete len:1009 (+),score=94.44 TRINITY_DN23335_c0_g2_i1:194-3220(+)
MSKGPSCNETQELLETSKRRGRWGRNSGPKAASDSQDACRTEGCTAAVYAAAPQAAPVSEADPARPVVEGRAQPASAPAQTSRAGGQKLLYTIGTWRVSREMYIWNLCRLDVKHVIDVRGNPRAGRQEELHRGRDLTRALQAAGIKYEYWGDKFGEEQLEQSDSSDVARALKGMLATLSCGPACMLGHMHEPHKCHRLGVCDLVPSEYRVVHLMWEDHQTVSTVTQKEAWTRFSEDTDFFWACKSAEEKRRQDERSNTRTGTWRRSHNPDSAFADGVMPSVSAAAAAAAALPLLVWQDTSVTEWEDRLRDGKAYRIVLPWNTEVLWYPRFLSETHATQLEKDVFEKVTMHHPTYQFQTPSGAVEQKINRKGQAKICDDFTFSVQYTSRRDKSEHYEVLSFDSWSRQLLRRVEAASETVFNAIWFNHYRDGTVTIHWHADSDEGLGPNAIIGSLSLGSARTFSFKSKRPFSSGPAGSKNASIVHLDFPLFHGSLIVMGRNSQTHWLHAVPAMEGACKERTNLTFRFYAHKQLIKTNIDPSSGDLANAKSIELRNSKLVQNGAASKGSAIDSSDSRPSSPLRLLLVPEKDAWRGIRIPVRPILVDNPSSEVSLQVGDFSRRLCETVMPIGIDDVQLALPTSSAVATNSGSSETVGVPYTVLAQHERVCEVLRGRTSRIETLLVLPKSTSNYAVRDSAGNAPALETTSKGNACSGRGNAAEDADDTQRELDAIPLRDYLPPTRSASVVPVADGGDWVHEVLTSLSGIQRKTKGKGQLTRSVFHQSSEFVALYAAYPKSSVHLIISPKRLVRRDDLGTAEASLVQRLARYGSHLSKRLQDVYPEQRFIVGLRLRAGRVRQLHAHLLSADLVPQCVEDLNRRHFLDFTAGQTRFLPLDALAARLLAGRGPPASLSEAEARALDSKACLACHRCGQIFGDAMLQLASHLARCEVSWKSCEAKSTSEKSQQWDKEVDTLVEMGFEMHGREALLATLKLEGSLERAVAALLQAQNS